jgi:hypothetical protein
MTEPAPVVVANPDPIEVTVANSDTSAQSQARSTAAKAAVEADILTTEGQRGINRLWERTQAIIAIMVVFVTLAVVAILIVVPVLRGETITDSAALVLLSALASNIVTSYFTRTNHTKTGGVGGSSTGRGE